MSGTLTAAAARGAAWTGLSQLLGQGMRLISMMVLARLLLPEDFGLAAMATIVTSVLLKVIDMGFGEAIIQRKELTSNHLSTAFWTMLGLGTILCLTLVAISPLFAKFFRNELVRPVLAVSSVSFIISAFGSIPAALLRKRLSFFKTSVADTGEALAYLAAAIPAAFAGLGVWSLVMANLIGTTTLVLLRWILCRWHPSPTFSVSAFKDLWGFGVNVTGTRLVEVLGGRVLDSFVVGKFLNATVLGFYSVASRVANFAPDILWFIINRVALPAFSMVQNEEERLRRGFLKSTAVVTITTLPMLSGLAVVAPELIRVLFGEKWIPAVLPAQILCISAIFSTLYIGVPSLFLAKGRPDINLKLGLVQVALLVPAALVGVRFGAAGVATAVLSVSVVIWLIRFVLAKQIIGFSIREYLMSLGPAVLGSSVMALALLAFRQAVNSLGLSDVWLLITSVLLGAFIYFIALKVSSARALDEIIKLVMETAKPYRKLAKPKVPALAIRTSNVAANATKDDPE